MTATPPTDDQAMRDNTRRNDEKSFAAQWAAVQDAASAVAMLAGYAPERPSTKERSFPALMHDAGGMRMELARNGVADLAAVLQPGLTALLAVQARGQNASAPAKALWAEYKAARDALLAFAPERGRMGPQRST